MEGYRSCGATPKKAFNVNLLLENLLDPLPFGNALLKFLTQEDKYKELKEENVSLHHMLINLIAKMASLDHQLTASHQRCHHLKDQLEIKDENIVNLQREIIVLRTQIIRENQANVILDAEQQEFEEKKEKLQSKVDYYMEKFEMALKESSVLHNDKFHLESRVIELKAQECEQNIQLDYMKSKLDSLQAAIDKYQEEKQHCNASILEDAMQKKEKLEDRLYNTLDLLFKAKITIDEKENKIKFLHEQYEKSEKTAQKYMLLFHDHKNYYKYTEEDVLQQKEQIQYLQWEAESLQLREEYNRNRKQRLAKEEEFTKPLL